MDPHKDYVRYIHQAVESVCPYKTVPLQRLYHAGFLASYLASKMVQDPWLFREFQKHIKELKEQQRQNKIVP